MSKCFFQKLDGELRDYPTPLAWYDFTNVASGSSTVANKVSENYSLVSENITYNNGAVFVKTSGSDPVPSLYCNNFPSLNDFTIICRAKFTERARHTLVQIPYPRNVRGVKSDSSLAALLCCVGSADTPMTLSGVVGADDEDYDTDTGEVKSNLQNTITTVLNKDFITWMTKEQHDGKDINIGSGYEDEYVGDTFLRIGGLDGTSHNVIGIYHTVGIIYEVVIFDHSLTNDEIEDFIIQNMDSNY